MSVIILGIFALNAQGIDGAIVQMVNHGIVIAALFLIAGAIEMRTRSRRLGDFGGLAARLPLLATVFMIAALAALGLPGLNSFAGEFLAFLGAFQWNVVLGGLGTLVVIPAAWYMLRFFQGVMEGPPREMALAVAGTGDGSAVSRASAGAGAAAIAPSGLVDLRWGELVVLLPLLALIFYLGFVPNVLTSRIERNIELRLPGMVVFPVSATGRATSALHPTGRVYVLVSQAPAQPQVHAAPVGAGD
jgi:NADH-quinone oxidoreductase subunit M